MFKQISFLKLSVVSIWLLTGLACGVLNQKETAASNTTENRPRVNAESSPKPAPSEETPTFTAQSLIAALKANKDELDKSLTGKSITVSGRVAIAIEPEVTFYSGRSERVRCSSGNLGDSEKFKLLAAYSREFAERTATDMPVATVRGVYSASFVSGAESWVSMDGCEVLQTSRL